MCFGLIEDPEAVPQIKEMLASTGSTAASSALETWP